MLAGKATATLSIPGQARQFIERDLTTEELDMADDMLAELVGDGQARVTTSLEMKDSDYGTGFGAHVSVSLSVDQTELGLEAGFSVALDYTNRFLAEAFDTAKRLRIAEDKDRQ